MDITENEQLALRYVALARDIKSGYSSDVVTLLDLWKKIDKTSSSHAVLTAVQEALAIDDKNALRELDRMLDAGEFEKIRWVVRGLDSPKHAGQYLTQGKIAEKVAPKMYDLYEELKLRLLHAAVVDKKFGYLKTITDEDDLAYCIRYALWHHENEVADLLITQRVEMCKADIDLNRLIDLYQSMPNAIDLIGEETAWINKKRERSLTSCAVLFYFCCQYDIESNILARFADLFIMNNWHATIKEGHRIAEATRQKRAAEYLATLL